MSFLNESEKIYFEMIHTFVLVNKGQDVLYVYKWTWLFFNKKTIDYEYVLRNMYVCVYCHNLKALCKIKWIYENRLIGTAWLLLWAIGIDRDKV